MTLYHLLNQHWGNGAPTGVPRFSRDFEKAFPEVVNITPSQAHRTAFGISDIVVTDNHLSLLVPDDVKCIVVHHGSAEERYRLDESWRSEATRKVVTMQRSMLGVPNRLYVAPSKWVASKFASLAADFGLKYYPQIIPHWCESFDREECSTPQRIVLGDWRNANKGADHVCHLMRRATGAGTSFRQIRFNPNSRTERALAYAGHVYLNLSLSEGFNYSMADAEACDLPIVSTDTGAAREFNATLIPEGASPDEIMNMVRHATRESDSFFQQWTFKKWWDAWCEVIERAAS